MAGQFANNEQLTFESILVEPRSSPDEQHFHVRRAGPSGLADVGFIEIHWQRAPSQQALSLLSNEFFNSLLADRSLSFILRKEHDPGAVFTGLWKIDTDIRLGDSRQKRMRQCGQHPGAVTRVGFAAASAAVIHVAQNSVGVIHDLM